MRAETELLLLLSRVDPDAYVLENAQAVISGDLNWGMFTSLSIQHGTAAMVCKNLLERQNVPAEVRDRFRGIYHNNLKSNILRISELDRVIDILEKGDIDVISLKGASASEKVFGDIGIYPSDDIDVLVKVPDIDRVRKILEADGYKLNDIGFDEFRDYFIKELYHINLSKGHFTIEPHWNLFMRYFITPRNSGGRRALSSHPAEGIIGFFPREEYSL